MAQIEDWLARNYEQVRIERGMSWTELADDFDRQNAPDLAAWARAQEPAPAPTRRAKPAATVETATPSPRSTR